MLNLSNSYAAVPTLLTDKQRDALVRLAAAFRKVYPEVDTLSAPFDADVAAATDDTTSDDISTFEDNHS